MSYYFPFGGADSISIQNISYSLAATTASVPYNSITQVLTASFAVKSGSVPPAGVAGLSITQFACEQAAISNPKLLVSGATGTAGATGSKGSDNTTCPDGTIQCIDLTVSLSANWTNPINGGRGVNYYRSSGSQFSIVCMQIPPGCTSGNTVCPPYLPTHSITSTYPSIS